VPKIPSLAPVQEKIGAVRQSHPPTVPEEESDLFSDPHVQKVNSCSPITHGDLVEEAFTVLRPSLAFRCLRNRGGSICIVNNFFSHGQPHQFGIQAIQESGQLPGADRLTANRRLKTANGSMAASTGAPVAFSFVDHFGKP
jgi:hypothetical protein